MRILSRYLLKQHLYPFVFALSALTAFQLLNQIARRFGDLVGKGLPWSVIVEVFALSIPFIVVTTLSMAVLVAVLYATGRLAADNEITAMRAGGISLARIVFPLFLAAVVIAVLGFLFSDQVLPRSNHRLRTLLTDISRKKPTFSLKEQVINEIQRNRLFLRAARINPSTFGLRDVTIYDLSDQERKRVIYADSGYMALTPNQETLFLTLFDGTMHELSRADPKLFQQIEFQRDVIRVQGIGNELTRTEQDTYKGDREMGVCEMESVIRTARREAVVAQRRGATERSNGVRALVGLAGLEPDTLVPLAPLSPYCRGLRQFAGFLLPAPLRAQAPQRPTRAPQDTAGAGGRSRRAEQDTSLVRRFNQPARRALTTGRVERPRLPDLMGYTDRARTAEIRAANYLVELHKKYAIAAACIVFVLIAVPVALQFSGGGVGVVIGVSLSVFAVYYVGLIAGEALANRLLVPPFWAMWTPNILFAILGLLGLWRVRRVGRGGVIPGPLARWLRKLGSAPQPGAGTGTASA